jgi:CheY-like chemotaxis protein
LSSVAVTVLERVAALHGGSLAVTDFGSSGFSITVELPMVFPDASTQPAATAETTLADAAKDERAAPFILLADDEEIIRTITKDYLESTGYRVACVTNGKEALDFLQTEVPDLLIMDMQMPVLDGMEALAQLRRSPDPRIAKTPVISLSGLVAPGHRERCLAAGANGCLAKPFGIKDLERVIKEFVGDRK